VTAPAGYLIGVALATESGLIVPVIRDTDTKAATQLGAESRKLAALAAEHRLAAAPKQAEPAHGPTLGA